MQYRVKRCPVCESRLKLTHLGKINKLWKCPNCNYTETLVLAGVWHPNNRRHQ
jgi:ribosomal protein L37AE/L43A